MKKLTDEELPAFWGLRRMQLSVDFLWGTVKIERGDDKEADRGVLS